MSIDDQTASNEIQNTSGDAVVGDSVVGNSVVGDGVVSDGVVAGDKVAGDTVAGDTAVDDIVTKDKPVMARASWLLRINLLCVWLLLAGIAYFFYQKYSSTEVDQYAVGIKQNDQELVQQKSVLALLQQQMTQVKSELIPVAELSPRIEQISKSLHDLQTVDRGEWLLAEAEYLLRLANQRLLMEKGVGGALPLLETADGILRDMDNLNLFSVREALARDIAAVKLITDVDRSGLYLELSALSEQIAGLPSLPRQIEKIPAKINPETFVLDADSSIWQRLQMNFYTAVEIVGQHIRIRQHDKPMMPLMSPEISVYVRQNLRLKLEQAQLAMLQENTPIYKHSLKEANTLLLQYFSVQEQAQLIASELDRLSEKTIHTTLPKINGSLDALKLYVQKFHDLAPATGKE